MDRQDIIEKLRAIKPALQKTFSVKTLGLFGSFADGTNTPESDVDIMVELTQPIGWHFFTLEKQLEQTLNRKIDLVTQNALKEQIKPYILKQMLYI